MMNKKVSKMLRTLGCVVLSTAIILSCACTKETEETKKKKKTKKTTEDTEDTTTEEPSDTDPSDTEPSDTDPTEPDIDPEAATKLHDLDYEILMHGMDSIYEIDSTFEHPEDFGLDWPDKGFDIWSPDDDAESYEFAKYVLDELSQIDYNSLELEDKILYETIETDYQYVVDMYGKDYYLSSVNDLTGLNTELPILFATQSVDSEEEAERYLIMLNDTYALYESMMAYEKERTARGNAYTDDILDNIIASCEAVYKDHDGNYMYTTFEEKVNALDIDDARKQELIDKNKEILDTSFFPAYEMMAETLESFKGTAQTSGRLCEMDGGKEYYEKYFQRRSGTSMTCDEAAKFLDDQIQTAIIEYSMIYSSLDQDQADLLNDYANGDVDITTGSFESDLEACMDAIKDDFPTLPYHEQTVYHIPESLADFFSPAAYMPSHLDDPTENILMINDYGEGLGDMLTTVAHEAYPGHLFETVYHLAYMDNYYLKSGSTAYKEGWSTYSELYIMKLMPDYDYDVYHAFYILMVQVLNYYLQARMDIGIHYEGWTYDDCVKYVSGIFGNAASEVVDLFYDRILEIPCYVTPYCFGNILCSQIINDAIAQYGNNYSLAEIHAAYLDMGCTNFDILAKYMDEFVEKQH